MFCAYRLRRSVMVVKRHPQCAGRAREDFQLVRGGLPALKDRHAVVAVHLSDEAEADFLGTNRFAGAGDRAVAEAFLVHLPDHVEHPAVLGSGRVSVPASPDFAAEFGLARTLALPNRQSHCLPAR
jgi:hypothetical protein